MRILPICFLFAFTIASSFVFSQSDNSADAIEILKFLNENYPEKDIDRHLQLLEMPYHGIWKHFEEKTGKIIDFEIVPNSLKTNGALHLLVADAWILTTFSDSTEYEYNNENLLVNQVEYDYWNDTLSNKSQRTYTYNLNNWVANLVTQNWIGGAWQDNAKTRYTYDGSGNVLEELVQNADTSGNWVNASRKVYQYDASDRETLYQSEFWVGSAWQGSFKEEQTYNGTGMVITRETYFYSGGMWDPSQKTIYTYDGNDNELSRTTQSGFTGTWVNSQLRQQWYDANSNNTMELNFTWQTSVWDTSSERLYTYDVNNNQLSSEWSTWWLGVKDPFDRKVNTYDANNNLTQILDYTHDTSGWVNQRRTIYTLNSNDLVLTDEQDNWTNMMWTPSSKRIYSYTSNDLLEEEINQFAWFGGPLENSSKREYSYDMLDRMVENIYSTWDSTFWDPWIKTTNEYYVDTDLDKKEVNHSYQNGVWEVTGIERWHYKTVGTNSINGIDASTQLIGYPNPAMNEIFIETELEEFSYQIFTLEGRKVKSDLSFNKEVDLTTLPASDYILNVFDMDGRLEGSMKFTKIR